MCREPKRPTFGFTHLAMSIPGFLLRDLPLRRGEGGPALRCSWALLGLGLRSRVFAFLDLSVMQNERISVFGKHAELVEMCMVLCTTSAPSFSFMQSIMDPSKLLRFFRQTRNGVEAERNR